MLEPIDEIKSRLDIIQVIREYLPNLKQAGANWKALCPFHTEKTPSFMVSSERQIWHCFGCGEGGDIFGFVMKYESVEFPEALRILAKKAGVILKKQDPKIINKKTRLLDICEAAANYWHNILLESPAAVKAREYLQARGLKPETIEDFKLGYSLDSWDALSKFLPDKNFTQDEIIASGLAVEKTNQKPGLKRDYYDRFRGRIMFPVKDVHGSIVGFTARILEEKQEGGKYINTPQTLIYDKSRVIYGLDKAKKEIREKNLTVVVEGNMDVIASHQAGITNVVASSGTAFTRDQIKLLKRYSSNLAICFDMDIAGETASERGIDSALQEGMNVKVVQIPQGAGKDPDDCLRSSPEGKKIWVQAINQTKSILEYFFEKTLARYDIIEVEGKKKAAKILLGVIAKIADLVEQTHYLQKLGEILGVPEQILREALPKSFKSQIVGEEEKFVVPAAKDRNLLLSERLLSLALRFPENLEYIIDHLNLESINNLSLRELYKRLVIYYTDNVKHSLTSAKPKDIFDYNKFREGLGSVTEYADKLVLLAEKDFLDFDDDQIRIEVLENIRLLKNDYIKRELKRLGEKIFEAEKRGEKDKIEELSKEFNRFTEQLMEIGL